MIEDVDARSPGAEQLTAEISAVRQSDVGEQPAVAVASALRPIAAKLHSLVQREFARRHRRLRRVARPHLRSVDADKPYALVARTDSGNHRIAVYYASDLASQCEPVSRRAFAFG